MKDRIERAKREYERIPKYGFARAPKAPTDLQLVTAFFHEDLSALQQIPINKGDTRTVRRALLAAEKLVQSATALLVMRDEAERAAVAHAAIDAARAEERMDGCTCPDIHACPFHGPPT